MALNPKERKSVAPTIEKLFRYLPGIAVEAVHDALLAQPDPRAKKLAGELNRLSVAFYGRAGSLRSKSKPRGPNNSAGAIKPLRR